MAAMQYSLTLLGFIPVAILYFENKADLRLGAPTYDKIHPVSNFNPTPASHEGVFAPNEYLHKAVRHFEGTVLGSENVAIGPDGALYMLDRYGYVLRSEAREGAPLERLAQLGAGRPLGFKFDASGNLIICNSGNGLQMLEMDTGRVVLLASEAPSTGPLEARKRIQGANDIAIARDGTIYFTDCTDIPPAFNLQAGFYDTLGQYINTLHRGISSGRVIKYSPASGETSVVAEGIRYANGIALGADESHLLVVETAMARVLRLWLQGPKAGQLETFLDPGLPLYPDGINEGSNGTFWVGLVAPRLPLHEAVATSRLARLAMARGPSFIKPKAKRAGGLAQISAEGKVLRYMEDPDGSHVSSVSAVTETPEGIWMGNLNGNSLAFLSKKDLPPPFPSS